MGWPKGKPRNSIVKPPAPDLKTEAYYDLVLGIRRIRTGSFMGLWELVKMRPDGSVKVVMDASSKASIVNLARSEIIECI